MVKFKANNLHTELQAMQDYIMKLSQNQYTNTNQIIHSLKVQGLTKSGNAYRLIFRIH